MNSLKPDFSAISAIFVTTRDALRQKDAILKLSDILNSLSIKMLLDERIAKTLDLGAGYTIDEIFKKTNLVISLGGDGNYIGACRRLAKRGAYIFGVNTGNLGFLTDVLLNESKEFICGILKGEFEIESPNLLQANFYGAKNESRVAFNDISLISKQSGVTAHIDAFLDDFCFNSYFGDGVMVASAMGSTAYNLSAGGAIIHPDTNAFSLTPICSHSLSQRPLVLPDTLCLKFTSKDDICVVIDGQDKVDLKEFQSVEIFKSEQKVSLIRKKERNYFRILKEKLRWGHQ